MVKIEPFHVEQWMDEYETIAKYNIAETCCASISVNELASLSDSKPDKIVDLSTALTYGEIRGATALRDNLARLYSSKVGTPLPADNILIQPGAISANFLVFDALVGPGDHVICHYPTYQALYDVPRSLGAEVDLWKADPTDGWKLDIEVFKKLIKPNTKLLVLNNPQNPTGAIIPKPQLEEIIAIAEEHKITILSDEVYRPLFHGITPMDEGFPPSILSMGYKRTIATGSLSKAYSLAGIRCGWIAARDRDTIEEIAKARDYTTISVSILDQQVAAFALSPETIHNLLSRNIQLAKANLELLEKFIIKHDEFCSWVKPVAGTTAFVKFERDGKPVDAVELSKRLMEKTGVMLVPGDRAFGDEFKGYVRVGYVNHTQTLKDGLEQMRIFMRKEYDDVPLSA
ncbi:pyridoxal phosphate-dependent transferase [Elsinoe ampelina]|uniref:Pyridoxal phosphate-dependent transferase n=1 Tax=Elsinoe ampelina TaxID=302913 RepID=A0A6A6GFV2_9PEZI|nr:pyridoxal phosphate-dependent transferase [Elsinoe ampelina]